MSPLNTALGFYQDPLTAQRVLKKLRRQGFKHSASIQHTHDGHVIIDTYHPSWLLLAFAVLLFLALLLFILIVPSLNFLLIPVLLLGGGGCLGWWLTRSRYAGIDTHTLNRFQARVIRDETLVIVQMHAHDVRRALAILRHVESGHPLSFLLRADKFNGQDEEELPKEPLPTEELQARATELAKALKATHLQQSAGQPLLKRLRKSERILTTVRHNVAEAEYVEQTVTLAAEWLLDNTHVIQGNLAEIQRSLPKKYYKQLPKIAEGSLKDMPRAYVVAQTIINNTASKLSRDNITAFIKSYQVIDPLTIGELWAIPLMLRMRLIESVQSLAVHIDRRLHESELASFWGNRLLNVARIEPEQLPFFLKDLMREQPCPSPHFAEELLDHLFDEETVLPLVRQWLEERLAAPLAEIIHREQIRKTAEQVALSNAIVSLITLSQLSWREVFEDVSTVDAILSDDPAGIYANMNFGTRDTYRHSIEIIARRSKLSETEIAHQLLKLAQQGKEGVTGHVGYYLIDAGRPILEAAVSCHPSFLQQLRRQIIFPPRYYLLR